MCVCVHPHRHSLSHACNDIQNFLHACVHFCMCVLLLLLLLLLYVYVCTPAECSARPSVAKTTLFYFLFKPTAAGDAIMAASKWQLLRLTIENELSGVSKRVSNSSSNDWRRERTSERANEWATIARGTVYRERSYRERTFQEWGCSLRSLSFSLSLVC